MVERVFDRTNTLRRRLARQFDALGRLDRARDALDASGQPLAGEALGDPQQGRVTADFEYDANGNRIGEVDGRGVRGRQVYDPLNRLIATIQDYGGTDPDTADATTRFGYDALDHLRTVTDPNGLVTRYEYDGLGNQTALISPDTGITRLTHDAAGNVLGRTDARGITARLEYDALNRLLAVRYPDPGQDQRYEYDTVAADCPAHGVYAKGRLTGFADESGSTRLCYDPRGRVVRKVQVTDNRTLRVNYSYSRSGRLRVVKYPSGLSVRYRYDATGRVKQVDWRPRGSGDWQPLLTQVVWLPFGPVEELRFPQRTQRREFDLNYGIAAIDAAGGLSLEFELDVQGNPVAVASPRGGPVVAEYRYDALQRLREVVLGGEVEERYRYDRTGNLVEGIVRGVGGTIEVGAHNRPRGWRLPNGSGQWRHNARGERVWVEARGGVGGVPLLRELIVHDESGRRLETRRLQPDSVQSLIWLDQLPVAVVQDGVVHAIEADHLGTPRLARDLATGEVSWRWDFFGSAFGGHAAENRGLDLALRFPGQYHDPATGLHYNYFRDYDPSTGRYVQSDPMGLKAGINTYAYVRSNPLYLFDMFGLAAQYHGFNRDDEDRMRAANEEARKTLASCAGCQNCGMNGERKEYCIDEYTKFQVISMLDSAEYRYVPPGAGAHVCAEHKGSNVINIYPNALGGNCCPLASTLAHEAGHAVGLTHRQIMYYERECFGCDRFSNPSRN
ncbi:MAG: RhsD protein [Lysobacteraceae bacterium]|nr:MAG: RhsD protein [Xanthomonadaceae bacterium]